MWRASMPDSGVLLCVEGLRKTYRLGRASGFGAAREITALDGVTLSVGRGESFGLVGESGSGKSTFARCVLALEQPGAGRVLFDGADIHALPRRAQQELRARMQIVFQDPYASLNPRMSVHDAVVEPMLIHPARAPARAAGRTDRAVELLSLVGLRPEHLHRFPHEFSGGQRQRIAIARALACGPEFLVLDEPTSALDVSVQAQVLNLLHDLQSRLGLTYLFISHDLAVVRHVCDRVALLYRGRIVEQGPTERLWQAPESDYARMLLAAMPIPDPDLSPLRTAPGGTTPT
jgi:ABC-type oligopeptide transport system ATPase subunit